MILDDERSSARILSNMGSYLDDFDEKKFMAPNPMKRALIVDSITVAFHWFRMKSLYHFLHASGGTLPMDGEQWAAIVVVLDEFWTLREDTTHELLAKMEPRPTIVTDKEVLLLAIHMYPSKDEFLLLLADSGFTPVILLDGGKIANAEQALVMAISRSPRSSVPYSTLALLLRQNGHHGSIHLMDGRDLST